MCCPTLRVHPLPDPAGGASLLDVPNPWEPADGIVGARCLCALAKQARRDAYAVSAADWRVCARHRRWTTCGGRGDLHPARCCPGGPLSSQGTCAARATAGSRRPHRVRGRVPHRCLLVESGRPGSTRVGGASPATRPQEGQRTGEWLLWWPTRRLSSWPVFWRPGSADGCGQLFRAQDTDWLRDVQRLFFIRGSCGAASRWSRCCSGRPWFFRGRRACPAKPARGRYRRLCVSGPTRRWPALPLLRSSPACLGGSAKTEEAPAHMWSVSSRRV